MKRVLASFPVFLLLLSVFSASVRPQIEVLEFDDDVDSDEIASLPGERDETATLPLDEIPKKLEAEDLIHYGDVIDVDVLGSVEYDWRGEITREGFLTGVNFLEKDLVAACRTVDSLAEEIALGYRKLLNKPKVVVKILDRSNRPVSTLHGAVSQPQRFTLKRKVFLNELIILSGGFTERASGVIRILRQPNTTCVLKEELPENESAAKVGGAAQFINAKSADELKIIDVNVSDLLKGKKESNPQIFYGDVIDVLIAQPVYVIGAVENPTRISIRDGLTVSRALASAGGLTKDANPKKIIIFRRDAGDTELIRVDLDKIKLQDEKDLGLKPFDVIQVSGRTNDELREPPIIRFDYNETNELSKLPLRIID